MLSPKYRLNRGEIALISRRGRVYPGPSLTAKVYELTSSPNARLAVVVSSKVSKTATGRNLIKRHLRHIISQQAKNLRPGYGIVLIARPGISQTSFLNLAADVETIFKQAHLFLTN